MAIKFGNVNIISCYISPNVSLADFENCLEDISGCARILSGQLLIGGDFNAHTTYWGCPNTNRRGASLERWAASFELRLLNQFGVSTCERPQGSSVVDLTWSSSTFIGNISDWIVRQDSESLSDHLYIDFCNSIVHNKTSLNLVSNKRWNFKKMDRELFVASLEFLSSSELSEETLQSAESYSKWLINIMLDACNVSTPRVSIKNAKRSVYWWSDEIADLRKAAIIARRQIIRHRRRGSSTEELAAYKIAKRALRFAIKRAKTKSWDDLIASIDEDPWGLPYKIAMNKLRRSVPTFSETLEKESLRELIDSLFPNNVNVGSFDFTPLEDWNEELNVTYGEVYRHIKKRPAKNTAPGSDNIKTLIWKRVPEVILGRIMHISSICLRDGIFR